MLPQVIHQHGSPVGVVSIKLEPKIELEDAQYSLSRHYEVSHGSSAYYVTDGHIADILPIPLSSCAHYQRCSFKKVAHGSRLAHYESVKVFQCDQCEAILNKEQSLYEHRQTRIDSTNGNPVLKLFVKHFYVKAPKNKVRELVPP